MWLIWNLFNSYCRHDKRKYFDLILRVFLLFVSAGTFPSCSFFVAIYSNMMPISWQCCSDYKAGKLRSCLFKYILLILKLSDELLTSAVENLSVLCFCTASLAVHIVGICHSIHFTGIGQLHGYFRSFRKLLAHARSYETDLFLEVAELKTFAYLAYSVYISSCLIHVS